MIFFPKIRIYTVHINPNAQHAMENPIFVPEGFNCKAFFFGPIWALYHRLWLIALALIGAAGLFTIADEKHWIPSTSILIIQLAFNFIVGYHANDWRRGKLTQRGFIVANITASNSLLGAQQRFFDHLITAA